MRRGHLLETFYLWVLAGIIFLIPTNIFIKFFEQSAYVHGLLVDYLLPKLYLSDILIWGLLLIWGGELFMQRFQKKNSTKRKKTQHFISRHSALLAVLMFSIYFLLFRQLQAVKPIAAIWYFLRLIEMSGLFLFCLTHRQLLKKTFVLYSLLAATFFQSFVALFQFFAQKSLISNYLFFGEPNLSHRLGLAKATFFGNEMILPYGTTAHPNVLGGFLALSLVLIAATYASQNTQRKILWGTQFLFGLVALFLTQSISAWLAFGIGIAWLLLTRTRALSIASVLKIFLIFFLFTPVLLHLITDWLPPLPSLFRRVELNYTALHIIKEHPLAGVGLNNFTAYVEDYAFNKELVRFIQPVHHVGLLWLSETGVLGLWVVSLAGLVGYQYIRHHKSTIQQRHIFTRQLSGIFLILLPLMVTDHYLLTLQTGLLLLTVWTTLYFTNGD